MLNLRLNARGSSHLILPLLIVVGVGVIGTYLLVGSHAATPKHVESNIVDVSYPPVNCNGRIYADKGIVGLNHGRPRTTNSCAKHEAKRLTHYAFYVNTSYAGQSHTGSCKLNTPHCWAVNQAIADAKYDLRLANKIQSPYRGNWWLDVEWDPHGNTGNAWGVNSKTAFEQNHDYLRTMYEILGGVSHSTVGFYSNPTSWAAVTGNWQNGHPFWLALGTVAPADAHSASANSNCKRDFTGKDSTYMLQYFKDATQSLDVDLPCSDQAASSF